MLNPRKSVHAQLDPKNLTPDLEGICVHTLGLVLIQNSNRFFPIFKGHKEKEERTQRQTKNSCEAFQLAQTKSSLALHASTAHDSGHNNLTLHPLVSKTRI